MPILLGMGQWSRSSREAWIMRLLLLAGALVVITGVGGWAVGVPLLIAMALLLRWALPRITGGR
jgi:hypothetical protein